MVKRINTVEERKIEWTDVHDSALKISLGIEPPDMSPKDPTVWTKTPKEKKLLKKYRKRHKKDILVSGCAPIRHTPIYGTLIVYILGKKLPKTTFSYYCNLAEIREVLNKFRGKSGQSTVRYYIWLGKRYDVTQTPYWYGK